MESKSKVTNVVFKKEGTGKYGPFAVFTITFENGDSGDYMAKSKDQNTFVIGQEVEYTKEVKQNGNYTNTIIKPKQIDRGGKFQNPAGMNKRCALENAVALCVAGKIEKKEIGTYSDNFNKWLNQ